MIKFSHFTLAAALLLGLATSVQAHDNGSNSWWSGCGGGGGGQPTLSCDAGGPYTVDWAPGSVTVQLNGLGSIGAQDYVWNTTYPGAYFNDAALPNPILLIPVTSGCGFNVEICLLVKRPGEAKTCCTTVRVRDRTRPEITCPETAKIISGMSTSPQVLGFATATDNCDPNPHISYTDKIVPPDCKADRFAYVIERTWRAVDDNCNVAKCVQFIDVVRYAANMDILPGSCPNLYNRRGAGTLAIAIAGKPGFDVTQIQWSTVRLYGFDCTAGPLVPTSLAYADVATPFFNSLDCNCTNATGDGKLDLVAQFSRTQINTAFDLAKVYKGEVLTVVITGKLCNGTMFAAQDCMLVY